MATEDNGRDINKKGWRKQKKIKACKWPRQQPLWEFWGDKLRHTQY